MLWVIALTTLAGFLALAVDAGNIVENNTNYQNAADAAALSAAGDIRQGTSTLAQAESDGTEDAVNIGNSYISEDGGSTGNWSTCTDPTGFAPQPTGAGTIDNCVAFYPYNLEETDVGTFTPTLSIGAGPEPFGMPIPASSIIASLTGLSAAPSGTVNFSVIGPSSTPPTNCNGGTTLGSVPLVTGQTTYSPASGYSPPHPGDYWWYASYTPGATDSSDAPANSGCTVSETMVGSATPLLTLNVPNGQIANQTLPADEIIADLTGTAGVENGDTVTFTVFGPSPTAPNDCTTGGTLLGQPVAVTGDGNYSPTVGFDPNQAGTYWWYAAFSGDIGNTPADSGCGSESTAFGSGPVVAVSVPDYATVGKPVTVNAILSGTANVVAGDTVTLTEFGPQASPPVNSCAGGTLVGTANVTGDDTYGFSFNPTQAGQYWWYAYFDGDTNNLPANSGCGAAETTFGLSVPTLTMSAPSTRTLGSPILGTDVLATLTSGSATPPTGDLTFSVFGPQQSAPTSCSSGGEQVGAYVPVNGNGNYNPSASFTPSQPGEYWWYVSYSGDPNNLGSDSGCGAVETTVGLVTPSLALSVPNTDGTNAPILGSSIGASLTGTSGSSAGGTITFYLDGPGAAPSTCPGSPGWAQLGAVIAVTGDATYDPSVGYTPTAPGDYWWYADYSGDADNLGANSACGRVETVVQTSESLSVTAPSSGTLNNAVAPTATLSGPITGSPDGTLTFWVYGPGPEPTSCPQDTTDHLWRPAGTATVTAYGTGYSGSYTPTASGQYWWYASYAPVVPSATDSPTDSGCGVVVWVQVPVQRVPSLLGTGGGGTLSPSAYAFGSTVSSAEDGELCDYPVSCSAATEPAPTGP